MIASTPKVPPDYLIELPQISIFINDRRIIVSLPNYADYISSETSEVKRYVTSETTSNRGQQLCLYFTMRSHFDILIMFIWDARLLKEERIEGGLIGERGGELRGVTCPPPHPLYGASRGLHVNRKDRKDYVCMCVRESPPVGKSAFTHEVGQ